VNPADSGQAVIGGAYRTYYRSSATDWATIDLVETAKDPQWQQDQLRGSNRQSQPVLILLLASLLCWLVAPWRVAKTWLQGLNLLAFALVVFAEVWAPTSQVDLLQLKVYWAVIVVAILALMRLIWLGGRCISAWQRSAAKPR